MDSIDNLVRERARLHHIRTSSLIIADREAAVNAIAEIEDKLATLWADNRQHSISYSNGKMVRTPVPVVPEEICIDGKTFILTQELDGWRKYLPAEEFLPAMRRIVRRPPRERILAELRIQFCIEEELAWLQSLKPLHEIFEPESA